MLVKVLLILNIGNPITNEIVEHICDAPSI